MHLPVITESKEMFISSVHVVMKTFFLGKIRRQGFKGHVANIKYNTQQASDQLPHIPSDLPVFVVLKPDQTHLDDYKKILVKGSNTIQWLFYLLRHHNSYSNIAIDHDEINPLADSDAGDGISHHITIIILNAEGEQIMEEEEKTSENDEIYGCLNLGPKQGGATGKFYKKSSGQGGGHWNCPK